MPKNGRYSRDKGARNERLVRDAIRLEGYECDRVPLSGAAKGFKGDLRVRGGGLLSDVTVEVKARKLEFVLLYELLNQRDGVHRVAVGDLLVVAGYSFKAVIEGEEGAYTGNKKPNRTERKFKTVHKYLGDSDVLAVKNDGRRPIYIRYFKSVTSERTEN